MYDEQDLINSPLERDLTIDGKTIEVCIYRLPDTGWTLETVDEHGNSTVWDGEFASDQEAYDFLLSEIHEDGIDALIGPPRGSHIH